MLNRAPQEKFNFYFSRDFISIQKMFILGGRMSTRL